MRRDRVMLIVPPHAGRAVWEFPLGVGYLANQIKKAGFQPEILDINALALTQEQVADRLQTARSRVFAISAFSTQYRYYVWLAQTIKALDKNNIIIAGGPLPTHQYKLVLKKTATDACALGEGDLTIAAILNHLDRLHTVKGVAVRLDGQITANPKQEPFDLDQLEFHPYHLFPEEIYFQRLGRGVNIMATRGCPYQCHFCSKTIPGLRQRSIRHIEEELIYLKKKYKIRGIRFSDELAITGSARGYEFCEMFSRLNLTWGGQVRVNLVDYKLLKHMKKSGCVSLGAGIESGSQKILANMKKGTTVQQNIDFINNCKKVGILPWVQLIFGYPGEDDATIKQTVDFFKTVHFAPPRPDYVGKFSMSSIATPLPGSKLYNDILHSGLISDEEEYTRRLEKGYYISRPSDIICNLTAYADDELFRKKEEMERTIWKNYCEQENVSAELSIDRSTTPDKEF